MGLRGRTLQKPWANANDTFIKWGLGHSPQGTPSSNSLKQVTEHFQGKQAGNFNYVSRSFSSFLFSLSKSLRNVYVWEEVSGENKGSLQIFIYMNDMLSMDHFSLVTNAGSFRPTTVGVIHLWCTQLKGINWYFSEILFFKLLNTTHTKQSSNPHSWN